MTIATTVPSPAPSVVLANLACMGSMLVWAIGFPLADALLAVLPPVTVTALRLAFATAFLLPVWFLLDGWQSVRGARWDRGLVVGAIGMGGGSLLLIYGQSRTDGVTTAVIAATMPIVGIALECLLDGRRLTARIVLGILLSFAGGVAVYAARMGHLNLGLGALATLGSTIIFTWASRASVTALPGLSALGRTAVTIAGGMCLVVAVQAVLPALGGQPVPWHLIGAREWIYAAAYGAASMALSQILFLIGVAGLGIGIAAMHTNVAPFHVMLFALAFGDSWSWPSAFAATLVLAGVILAQTRPRA